MVSNECSRITASPCRLSTFVYNGKRTELFVTCPFDAHSRDKSNGMEADLTKLWLWRRLRLLVPSNYSGLRSAHMAC